MRALLALRGRWLDMRMSFLGREETKRLLEDSENRVQFEKLALMGALASWQGAQCRVMRYQPGSRHWRNATGHGRKLERLTARQEGRLDRAVLLVRALEWRRAVLSEDWAVDAVEPALPAGIRMEAA